MRLLLVLLLLLPFLAHGKRLRDRIYIPVQAASFCFRRTNGTHQFGCTSDVSGNVGVVHVIRTPEDLDWVLNVGPHDPYVAVFLPAMFTNGNLVRFRDSGKAAGAILLNHESIPLPRDYSDDSKCPNSVSDLYRGTEDECRIDDGSSPRWNPGGSGNLFESFPFPIFVSGDNDTTSFILNDCYDKFNKPGSDNAAREWPLCSMELKAHMYSAVNTETCLRRSNIVNIVNPTKFCDEMGDQNTFLFLKERNSSLTNEEEEEEVVVVSTRIDTVNMFDGSEFGSDSPVTNIVATLEAARLLSIAAAASGETFRSNVLFAFFHGEAFDYIGSSRLAYDMHEGKFPNAEDDEKWKGGQQPLVNLTNIQGIVEVGQLFSVNSGGNLFVHTDEKSRVDPAFISSFVAAARNNNLTSTKKATTGLLPPSSLQSFLRVRRSIPGLYVSDHDASYTNRYYHSIYDKAATNLGYEHALGPDQTVVAHISRVAMTVAQFVYEQATSSGKRFPRSVASNRTLVNELLHCYLDTARCPLFLAASNGQTPMATADYPFPQYVGVDYRLTGHGTITRNLLAYLTGVKIDDESHHVEEAKDCVAPADQNVYEHLFLKGESVPPWWSGDKPPCNESADCGYCYKTLTFRRDAVSPAFVIEGYDVSDSRYGAWAESVWKTSGARVFLKASPALQKAHFAAGVVVLVLSFLIVFWVNRYSGVIFSTESDVGEEGNNRESTSTAETRAESVDPAL